MDTEDKINLGVAGIAGTLTSAAAAFAVWTVASTMVSGTGAAAISATIAALGGISTITGGTAFVAFGAGYVVWQFIHGDKKRSGDVVKQLETRLYTITEKSNSQLVATIQNHLVSQDYFHKVFVAPDIPIDKLAKIPSILFAYP